MIVKKQEQAEEAARFTGAQWATSTRYAELRDAATALLAPQKLYTAEEAEAILDGFMKRRTKEWH